MYFLRVFCETNITIGASSQRDVSNLMKYFLVLHQNEQT